MNPNADFLDYSEPPDPGDWDFLKPKGECAICDEPTWLVKHCDECHRLICPACECDDIRDIEVERILCPQCEGAGIYVYLGDAHPTEEELPKDLQVE